MTWSYDPATIIGQVRLNCQDTSQVNAIFSDEEITAFLAMNDQNVFRAAADALDIIASNQSYILKVFSENGTSINGPAVAADLRTHARTLREKAQSHVGTVNTGLAIVVNPDTPYLRRRTGL